MKYRLAISPRALRQLHRLPKSDYASVAKEVDALADEPRPRGAVKMHGANLWRIRVGDYRVLYGIDDSIGEVAVVRVGHRRDVYRDT
ncbi:MAG: type II toxin-antitoxin system RelE/ParE family toxin [Chloroflexi bacterium]|nr:type II toxin-antitoxin system RelE/ParE family toxin [Chloroflexota bacterium]